ncbi:MAG: ABC transporter ATP-binding protein/permease [Firmicutes bacterium]|nr:ABC transporter ATP-binding protein/permease [Bacillota bacterium]MCD7782680.1 ABC transporter ATP-binding protein/permease [Bacillota bacterium]MCD8312186.1 ABC transporter ATP-binding protein/permease [Bacillota bacterium]MCD8314092.1 ABC transporter ATP-binding protein/permease [Bacillota bacterium]
MIKLFRFFHAKEWVYICISVLFIVLQVQLDLTLPDYMSEITTLIETEGSEMSDVLSAGGKMLLCALGSLASAVIVGYLAARTSANFSMSVRDGVYSNVMSFSDEEVGKFSTASLITRTTNDITQVQMFVSMGMQVIIKAPIMAVMAIAKISAKNWQWTALTAAVIVFIVALLAILMVFALPKFRRIQGLTDNLNRVTRESLTGILVMRAYNAEEYQNSKFDAANKELTDNNRSAYVAMSLMNPGLNLAMNGLSLGIYWIGAILISNVAVTGLEAIAERVELLSEMVVFMQYSMQVVMAFLMLVMVFLMMPRALVAAGRINEVLGCHPRIKDGRRRSGADGVTGEVEFKNVSFRYPESDGKGGGDVIHNISFKAERGQTVALIGATGSGKSTIVNLIPRIYDATEGEVIIDGVNVKEYTQKSLHEKIGFVPQKAFLFSGTVEENVGYGIDASADGSKENIRRAVEIAQSKEFVESPAVGYDGYVAATGSNFSGGQKQRLSIARAVAKNPEILVFDDSFSALDYKTDKNLRSALKSETSGTTNIIVAQRIGTIMDADRILVIDNGQIVGDGKHDELMKKCDVYREIAHSQLSEEELGA